MYIENRKGGMGMKKFKMSVAALVVALLVPSSTIAYGTGDWDDLGEHTFTDESKIFYSGGGDLKVCLSEDSQHGLYDLYEEDPFNPDDLVEKNVGYYGLPSNGWDSNGCHIFRDIGGFVDDGQAEFYLKIYDGGKATVHAWD